MKILMFLENSLESLLMDARVKKEAVSLSGAGHEVTILLFDRDLDSEVLDIDGARIIVLGLKHRPEAPALEGARKRIYANISGKAMGSAASPILRVSEPLGFRKMRAAYKALPVALGVDADIYHAHDYATLWLAAFCARFHGKKFVYDSHELWSDCWIRGRLQRFVIRSVERRLLPEAEAVITVNGSIARIMARRYGIPRPVVVSNFPRLQPVPKDPVLRETLNIPGDRPIVIYAGEIKHDRGIRLIQYAAKHLPGVEFVLMGRGRPPAVQGGNFHVIGPVPQADVVRWLSSATVGIHPMLNTEPNQYYSLGNKVGDYIMAGLPIAVSDFPEMRKLARRDKLGVVFDPARPKDVVRALREMLEPGTLASKKRNVLANRDRYTWDKEELKLLAVYKRLEGA